MAVWNSFKRIESVFNAEIPDRVPIFEISIEIPELNPLVDGQEVGSGILFFPPQLIEMFHEKPSLISQMEQIVTNPRTLETILGGSPKKNCSNSCGV